MTHASIVAVAGPSGVGKTTWIAQCLSEASQPAIYVPAGRGDISVELAYIGYRFPRVRVVDEKQLSHLLDTLSEPTVVYVELDFSLDLQLPLPMQESSRRVAILPSSLKDSRWHAWADEMVPGNEIAIFDPAKMPDLWTMSLAGQVFDAPSLDDITNELTGGAYGKVHRMKGMFELPDGRSFHVDFVEGLDGLEYAELNLPRWLDGRPQRFSGIEVVGWNLEGETVAQTLFDGCLSDEAIAHYQHQYKSLVPEAAAL
ncbi:MAG: GTP-binding protein [Cyanobacteria bacterium P01_A01_bin.3]